MDPWQAPPSYHVTQVLDQGSLFGTREPSAACIGRIAKIQKRGRDAGGTHAGGGLRTADFGARSGGTIRSRMSRSGTCRVDSERSAIFQIDPGWSFVNPVKPRKSGQEGWGTPSCPSLDDVERFIYAPRQLERPCLRLGWFGWSLILIPGQYLA